MRTKRTSQALAGMNEEVVKAEEYDRIKSLCAWYYTDVNRPGRKTTKNCHVMGARYAPVPARQTPTAPTPSNDSRALYQAFRQESLGSGRAIRNAIDVLLGLSR